MTTEGLGGPTRSIALLGFGHGFVDVETLDFGLPLFFPELKIGSELVVDHGHDRFENLVVSGATAKVPRHPLFNFFFRGPGVLVEQRFGSHDLAGSANPALKTAVLNKRLLQWMQRAVFCEPLNGFDFASLARNRQGQARADQAAVDNHAARAADANAAAFFCACEANLIAKRVE